MTEAPWYTTRGFVASAALLFVIGLTSAATALLSHGGRAPVRGHPVTAGDRTWGSRCGLAHGSQDSVVGPPAAAWALVGHIAAPRIPGVGPGVVTPGDRRCYQHSPLGALLAAANWLPVGMLASDPRTGMDHFVPGRLRDTFARQPVAAIDPNTTVATVAFRMTVLARDAVDVQIALRINGALGYVTLPMRWTTPQGDWRVQLLSAAEPLDAGGLDSLADYIPWSA